MGAVSLGAHPPVIHGLAVLLVVAADDALEVALDVVVECGRLRARHGSVGGAAIERCMSEMLQIEIASGHRFPPFCGRLLALGTSDGKATVAEPKEPKGSTQIQFAIHSANESLTAARVQSRFGPGTGDRS